MRSFLFVQAGSSVSACTPAPAARCSSQGRSNLATRQRSYFGRLLSNLEAVPARTGAAERVGAAFSQGAPLFLMCQLAISFPSLALWPPCWGPLGAHLNAEAIAGPVHLASAVDDGLAHRALIEHRQLYRHLCAKFLDSDSLIARRKGTTNPTCQPCKLRGRPGAPHLGIDHAVCCRVGQGP